MHAATAVLDHQQDVQAAEEDGVDVGEVDGKDRAGLRAEELRPGWTGSSWRRIESRVLLERVSCGKGTACASGCAAGRAVMCGAVERASFVQA